MLSLLRALPGTLGASRMSLDCKAVQQSFTSLDRSNRFLHRDRL